MDTHSSKPEPHFRFSLQTLLVCLTVSALCLGLIVSAIRFLTDALEDARKAAAERSERYAAICQADRAILDRFIEEVEALHAKLGRPPTDETELELLLEKPIPDVHIQERLTPIHYYRVVENSYVISYPIWINGGGDQADSSRVHHYFGDNVCACDIAIPDEK